jgi:hypothetical protein
MGPARGDRILLDTNVILAAHRQGCWAAMAGAYRLITVEKVIEETQTGQQQRRPEQNIDKADLRASFTHVASVTREQLAEIDIEFPDHGLDPGEHHLVAHAATLGVGDAWLINSPDKGTIRFCSRSQWLDRLISLEAMAERLGMRIADQLPTNFSESWLRQVINQFRFGLL